MKRSKANVDYFSTVSSTFLIDSDSFATNATGDKEVVQAVLEFCVTDSQVGVSESRLCFTGKREVSEREQNILSSTERL